MGDKQNYTDRLREAEADAIKERMHGFDSVVRSHPDRPAAFETVAEADAALAVTDEQLHDMAKAAGVAKQKAIDARRERLGTARGRRAPEDIPEEERAYDEAKKARELAPGMAEQAITAWVEKIDDLYSAYCRARDADQFSGRANKFTAQAVGLIEQAADTLDKAAEAADEAHRIVRETSQHFAWATDPVHSLDDNPRFLRELANRLRVRLDAEQARTEVDDREAEAAEKRNRAEHRKAVSDAVMAYRKTPAGKSEWQAYASSMKEFDAARAKADRTDETAVARTELERSRLQSILSRFYQSACEHSAVDYSPNDVPSLR
jgi:hypothetical protein